MKKLLFSLLTALCLLTSSCELIDITLDQNGGGEGHSFTFDISPCEDGENISIDSLPQAILDYLNGEYPNIEIEGAEVFFDQDQQVFGVSLANGLEILFDETGVVISSGDENMEVGLAVDSLLQGILDYINTNFPEINIDTASIKIEFGEEFFEIDLENGLDLFFDELGDFVCQDMDDGGDDDGGDDDGGDDDGGDDDGGDDDGGDDDGGDDDGGDDDGGDDDGGDDDGGDDDGGDDDDGDDDDGGPSLNDLPDSVLSYITELFPGLTIEDIDLEELCGEVRVIEIELEDENGVEIEVYFSLDWDYLFMSMEITEADLPMAVLDSLAAAYPGYSLEEDDIYKWTLADGSIQYNLEVETDQEDYDVVIDEDGTIVCTE